MHDTSDAAFSCKRWRIHARAKTHIARSKPGLTMEREPLVSYVCSDCCIRNSKISTKLTGSPSEILPKPIQNLFKNHPKSSPQKVEFAYVYVHIYIYICIYKKIKQSASLELGGDPTVISSSNSSSEVNYCNKTKRPSPGTRFPSPADQARSSGCSINHFLACLKGGRFMYAM